MISYNITMLSLHNDYIFVIDIYIMDFRATSSPNPTYRSFECIQQTSVQLVVLTIL